jgi:hypothetical protein
VSWWVVVLAWLGLANGLAAAAAGLVALNRVLRPLREIERYADDTLEAARGIERNLEGIGEALRTRSLVAALRDAVGGG